VNTKHYQYLRVSAAVASSWALAGAFYGCSGDDNVAVVRDAGLLDATSTGDGSHLDSSLGDSSTLADGAHPDGTTASDAGPITQKVTETVLFSNLTDAGALNTDPNLMNAWGLAFNPNGTAWVADNKTGVVTTYTPTAKGPLTVTVPSADGGGTGSPTGQIFNGVAGNFDGDVFILATEDGTIQGWQPGDAAVVPTSFTIRVDASGTGAVYKGLAIVQSTPPVLVGADFHNNLITVWDTTYAKIVGDGGAAWTHPNLPAGFAPFNIVSVGTNVYVAYAKQDAAKKDDVPGPGLGILSVFDTTGTFQKDLVGTGGAVNAPWGIALAPANWGSIGGNLIVGNFGDGTIHSFDTETGVQTSTLATNASNPLVIDGLWALVFGAANTDAGETTSQLFFTAGPNMEKDGLFGFLTPQ
jgi:uncharacterized protein (TIGR03118 family)